MNQKKVSEIKKLFKAYTSLAELPNRGDGIDSVMTGMKISINDLLEQITFDQTEENTSSNQNDNLNNELLDSGIAIPKFNMDMLKKAQEIAESKEKKPHQIITELISQLNIKKKTLILLMEMSVSNTAYFNGYLTGEKIMTKKMGLKFIKAFKRFGVNIPLESMGLQRVNGKGFGSVEYL